MIIGVAVTRNRFPTIDTPVLEFFPDVANLDDRKCRMEALYDSPENSCSIMEAATDWVRYAFDRPTAEEPGARFNYNSGATQLLAHIFAKATGADIEEYGAQNLFARLAFTHGSGSELLGDFRTRKAASTSAATSWPRSPGCSTATVTGTASKSSAPSG